MESTELIRLKPTGAVEEHLASTPGTRRIANDPLFLGVDYTSALHLAFGWNRHATDFLSAQRTNGADGWRIDESSYRKLSFAGDVSLVLGDVVATGTSLRHALGVTIERCAIYDAGSRAFLPDEHLADVTDYWRRTLALARTGVTYVQLLAERFPGLDPRRFGPVDLVALCERRLAAIRNLVGLPRRDDLIDDLAGNRGDHLRAVRCL